jgi:hypothetical protein
METVKEKQLVDLNGRTQSLLEKLEEEIPPTITS